MIALSPLHDQDLAALVMMLEQVATIGTFAALRARRLLREQPDAAPSGRHPLAV